MAPRAAPVRLTKDQLRELMLQPLRSPATALEIAQQLPPFPFSPAANALARQPVDPGLKDAGWRNPYRTALYPFTPDTANSIQALPANPRRAYLVIQNKGPGNLYVNFNQWADALNSVTLVPSQQWELIGGQAGGSFVPSDAIYVLTDLAGTTGVVVEGVAVPVRQPGA